MSSFTTNNPEPTYSFSTINTGMYFPPPEYGLTNDDLKIIKEFMIKVPILEAKMEKLEYLLDEIRYIPEIGDIYMKAKQNFEDIQRESIQ